MRLTQAATFAGAATILICIIGAFAHLRYLLGYSDDETWSRDAKQISVWVVWTAVATFLIGMVSHPS